MIHKRIDEIRNFYGGANGNKDGDLAGMMLRDACFLICYMQEGETHTLIRQRLGMSGVLFVNRVVFMLENQIPLWLIFLIHPDHQSLLPEFLNNNVCGDNNKLTQLPWESGEEEEPIHLLEVVHRVEVYIEVIIDIPRSRRRMLHRVPVQLRRGKTHIYEPAVVSLGPYHHRRDPQLQLVEPFKDELRDIAEALTENAPF
ncbi:hypothetical protein SASPL_151811 [Salvia splendens]|uniref:Uncharacterized protein n=1 Tax=Salvia splendens TaxID=180675 RepID=A0A8X8W292_SALSN|nr:hypothetical protein SASPL_151811 [Salvia splendens]